MPNDSGTSGGEQTQITQWKPRTLLRASRLALKLISPVTMSRLPCVGKRFKGSSSGKKKREEKSKRRSSGLFLSRDEESRRDEDGRPELTKMCRPLTRGNEVEGVRNDQQNTKTVVSFRGQTPRILCGLSQKRDCCPKRAKKAHPLRRISKLFFSTTGRVPITSGASMRPSNYP